MTRSNIRLGLGGGLLLVLLAVAIATLLVLAIANPPAPEKRPLVQIVEDKDSVGASLQALSKEEITRQTIIETEILKRQPLDREAVFNLSVLAELSGDRARWKEMVLYGARLSRREPKIQLQALDIAVRERNFELSAKIMDGLLRSQSELSAMVFPATPFLIADEKGLDALAPVVALNPPWRNAMMADIMARDPKGNLAYAYLSGLKKRNVEVKDSEISRLVRTLASANDYDRAYFVWLDFLDESRLAKAAYVYDGGFDFDAKNMFFDWTFTEAPNVSFLLDKRAGNAVDRALSITFLDFKSKFGNVRQYLRLGPGVYNLAAEAETRGVKTDGGLKWQVRCVEQPSVVGQSEVFKSNASWTSFGFEFVIGTEGCATQVLELVSASSADLDNRFSGKFSFDNFVISPKP